MANAHLPPATTLRALAPGIALLLLALLATAAMGGAILHYGRGAELAHRQALARQAESRNRLARAKDDEREIRARIARYQELVAQGRTMPERRLDWVETLRHIKESRRLLGLDYEISPQQPLDPKLPASGGHRFLVSPMRLEMPLLHEGDLLGLIADLTAQAQALVSVKQCRIERLPQDPAAPAAATLRASCTIDWITLEENS